LPILFIFDIKFGDHNQEVDKLINSLSQISLNGQKADLKETIDHMALFPTNTTDYWTYQGSLTMPPCSECVRWVVFKQPIQISAQQVMTKK
jgi:carbonic anhydrase